jgi:hypothetical protein
MPSRFGQGDRVSEHDAHQQHKKAEHEHDRSEKKHELRERRQHPDRIKPAIHPKWFFVIGLVLVLTVILVWTFFL